LVASWVPKIIDDTYLSARQYVSKMMEGQVQVQEGFRGGNAGA